MDSAVKRVESDSAIPSPRGAGPAPGEVHVWIVSTGQLRAERAGGRFELSDSERQRADRYRFEGHREAFELRRGFARRLLRAYCGPVPESLELDECCVHCGGAHGKPRLAAGVANWLQFSWSHSDDRVAYAFAHSTEIGIDIERIDIRHDWRGPARQALAPSELERVEKLPASRRAGAFYALWTRKEAVAKATALGLALPLRDIVLSTPDGDVPQVIATAGGAGSPADWTVRDLDAGGEFAAAVAVRGRLERLRLLTEPSLGLAGIE